MPTSEMPRRRRSLCGDDERLSAAEANVNRPNMPTAHAPIDIGSQNLNTRIMLRNRVGTPRSAISRRPHAATSGSAMK
jgi:hypothetical protein